MTDSKINNKPTPTKSLSNQNQTKKFQDEPQPFVGSVSLRRPSDRFEPAGFSSSEDWLKQQMSMEAFDLLLVNILITLLLYYN